MRFSRTTFALALLVFATVSASAFAESLQASTNKSYRIETLADNLPYPWSLDFLPNGNFIVAMRSGELHIIGESGKTSRKITGLPTTYFAGQGGFFDVLLDRNFKRNQKLYLSYAAGNKKANRTTVASARLSGDTLLDVKKIFEVTPSKNTSAHYGGRLLQLADNSLLLTTGDGFQFREAAQDRFSQLGKVVRFNPDGSLPSDNPFASGENGDPAIWTLGHRNPQGLAIDSLTGNVYLHEHGPKGGDEVNLLLRGHNYGWPAVTHGINYSGALISPFTSAPGMQDPKHVWVPSIAPSGLAIYRGNAFPKWQGNFFVGALVDKEVRMLSPNEESSWTEQALFSELNQRIRDVREGPDGFIYLLTDSEVGALMRVLPVAAK